MVNNAIGPTNSKATEKDILDAALRLTNINKTPQGPAVGSAAVKPNKNNEKSKRIATHAVATSIEKKSEGIIVDAYVKPTEKTKSSENAVAGGVLPIQKKNTTQGVEKSTNKEKPAEEANKIACKLRRGLSLQRKRILREQGEMVSLRIPRLALLQLLNKS